MSSKQLALQEACQNPTASPAWTLPSTHTAALRDKLGKCQGFTSTAMVRALLNARNSALQDQGDSSVSTRKVGTEAGCGENT